MDDGLYEEAFMDGKTQGLPGEYMEYFLYLDRESDDETASQHLIRLQSLCIQILAFSQEFTSKYLWEIEPFNLVVKVKSKKIKGASDDSVAKDDDFTVQQFLWGRQLLGDNIDDEWLSTRIIFEITTKYPQLIGVVVDSDGQFLLAEAALEIPTWLNPDNANNRVLIKEGKLHIIPLPSSPSDFLVLPTTPVIDLSTALSVLRSSGLPFGVDTVASESVQEVIWKRIGDLDGFIERATHYAKCWVPQHIAELLQNDPQLIAPAILAFCERDQIQGANRIISKMEKFGCSETKEKPKMVWVMVRFTRVLYARAIAQLYNTPKRSDWWTDPGVNLTPTERNGVILGLKVAIGFELLYQSSKHRRTPELKIAADHISSYNFGNDSKWNSTLDNLCASKWTNSENEDEIRQAKTIYLASAFPKTFTYFRYLSPATSIDNVPREAGEGKSYQLFNDSNEDWLYIDPKEVDDKLAAAEKEISQCIKDMDEEEKKKNEKEAADKVDANEEKEEEEETEEEHEAAKELDSMITSMKGFLGTLASFEGAELPKGIIKEDNKNINLDPKKVAKILGEMFDLASSKAKKELEGESDSDNDEMETDFDFKDIEKEFGESMDIDGEEVSLRSLMQQMDSELSDTTIGKSFERVSPNEVQQPASQSKQDDSAPVDINFNLVKNILQSLEAQGGAPGPVSNILGTMKQK